MTTVGSVRADISEVALHILDLGISRRDEWQKFRRLAQSYTGNQREIIWCRDHGLWQITDTNTAGIGRLTNFNVFIDCQTGWLVTGYSFDRMLRLTPDFTLVQLFAEHPSVQERFNVDTQIKRMHETLAASKPASKPIQLSYLR